MVFRISLLLFLGSCSLVSASDKIIDLIRQGDIDAARSMIAEGSTAARREGTLLLCQAMLEPDGGESLRFLKAAFAAGLPPQEVEDDIYLQAQYYLADGDYENLASTARDYLREWETGKHRAPMLRLAALASDRLGKRAESERFLDLLIKENPENRFGAIGKLDKAGSLYRRKDYTEAQNICRKLGQSKYDDVVAPAYFMLSFYSIDQKRIDDAILYYNLLREGYKHAVGLDDLAGRFEPFDSAAGNHRAEEITGTVYSVQVGVFSVEDNAKKLARHMETYGEKVEIGKKKISDTYYYVVYVGRFLSSADAMAFKSRLELSEQDAFQVVAR
jgi:tetratricopeptide (TPR) repeat protein